MQCSNILISDGRDEFLRRLFRIVDSIMQTHASSLRQFTKSFSAVLDHMNKLELGQVRKLFRILTSLHLKRSTEDTIVNNNLFAIVRKQFKENSERSGKMAVIASFGLMSQMAEITIDHNDKAYSDKMSKEIVEIYNVVDSAVEFRTDLLNLFFEEISQFMELMNLERLSSEILDRFKDTINDFAEMFLTNVNEIDSEEDMIFEGLHFDFRFNLNESYSFVVDLPKIMESKSEKNALCLALPAFVKCFCALNMHSEIATANCTKLSLTAAKQMLEIPFLFPEEKYDSGADDLSLSETQLQFIGDCNLTLANVLRETVNVTNDKNANIIQDKSCLLNLSLRLKLLSKAQKRFLDLLKIFPGYEVPGICNPYYLSEKSVNGKSGSSLSLPHQATLLGLNKVSKIKTSAARSRKRKRPTGSGQDEEECDDDDDEMEMEDNDVISNTGSRSQDGTVTQGHGTTVLTAPLSTAYSELGECQIVVMRLSFR